MCRSHKTWIMVIHSYIIHIIRLLHNFYSYIIIPISTISYTYIHTIIIHVNSYMIF
nr:MAG TPA: hypothetical protein [Caudoviricetes sp.]